MHSSDDALTVGNSPDTKPHKIITRQTSQHTLTSTSSTKNATGISLSTGSSVSELPTFQSEHPASVTESQTSAQSMQTSVVTPSANRTAMITATRTSQALDIKTSEKIPEPVATELDKWFRKHKNGIHPGAVTCVCAQYNNPIWVPSSGRRPVFEDRTGQKLQAQLYSLKKAGWIRNGRYMVLVVWNDAQSPVIIKGVLGGPGSKSKKQPPPGRSLCRIWKGKVPGTTPAGFLKDSFVFMVRHDELHARAENTLEEAPLSGPNTYTASSSLHSAPPSPALLSRDQARKSKPDDLTVVRQDPREALRHLPSGLRVMLGDYYDKNGTHHAPVCACDEKRLSFAIDVYSSIVLQDSFGSKVPMDRFPTGFEGYVFLVAKGETIIRYSLSDTTSRNYVAWYGDELFEPIDLFDYQTTEPQRMNWQGIWILAGRSCRLTTLIQMQ
ncbi:hypothetical protein EPUS_05465 [Endocarpon pusillum Z07020]|uniref:Uncharacterized protein n=1 Tax=Endocarpon pusillum (strain Z07020 / HMAS-L-300199) TaxID=1263415 RepID=U1GDX3_ENDPU|nr:uncharacterized protein EPUS_05465 [Endocarpon pusillum Z07020]ERF69921.1 hypothetical protein EPUS_05465 [Endocarpon pusillum Z07020]